ncbi:aromatic ring hydroxylase [Micromonospora globispora]|uniref:FAD-dependent monooxygenase n=1 Tax=Micromonospora globispora TaxID=1450148 RepID=UPI000D6EFA24|nr:FAD-dependent monooxygenase [Micromonospora globispora]PWU55496.1 aromatic ring hydroxylase [Micromonospora globispora]RQW98024.1 aromatic ring hydroxylase [Micromonospora globispora]
MSGSPYYQPRPYAASRFDSTPSGESLPVVVVGAGPVGMAVGLGLAAHGIAVTIVEAATSVSVGSRAICISRHSQEIADRLGFRDALARRGLAWDGGRSFFRDREVLHFQMPHDAHSLRPPMINISQSEIEEMMVDRVSANPLVTLHWGAELTGVAADDDGVTLTVTTVDGERTLRADRVVAADGGRSRTRELMGLQLAGTAYEGRYVIADIHWKSGLPTERMVWFDPPSNPGSTVIMHRQPDDIWRIDYQLSPEDDVAAETTEDAIRARIGKHLAWLENHTPWTLEWHGFYKALALALDDFVHGRVIFAGDAAHLVPIFGVRGLNSGLEDADTLAWMLAAVVFGTAGDELLAAYAAERRDAWQQNIDSAGKSTLIMTPGTPGFRATRDALLRLGAVKPEFSHLIDPRQSRATHARRSPLTVRAAVPGLQCGDPLEDRRIVVDGKQTSLHGSRGSGFGVYAVEPVDADAAEMVRANLWAALPHEEVTVVPLQPGADGGAAESWQASPGEIVAVRPDGIVLARGTADELADVANRLVPGAPDADAADPAMLTPEQADREQVWLSLSRAIDDSDDPEGLLTRLALVLGAEVGADRLLELLVDIG